MGDVFTAPGDYDGDGKADFCIHATLPGSGSSAIFYLLKSADFGVEYVPWGLNRDFVVPGDYDGDGKTDLAIWRASVTPGQSGFWVKKSFDGGVIFKSYGANGDRPAAAWQTK